MKWKTFFIIFEELSVARNCLRPAGAPLTACHFLKNSLLVFILKYVVLITNMHMWWKTMWRFHKILKSYGVKTPCPKCSKNKPLLQIYSPKNIKILLLFLQSYYKKTMNYFILLTKCYGHVIKITGSIGGNCNLQNQEIWNSINFVLLKIFTWYFH